MNADSSLCACILDLELRLLCRNVSRSLAELEQLLADGFRIRQLGSDLAQERRDRRASARAHRREVADGFSSRCVGT